MNWGRSIAVILLAGIVLPSSAPAQTKSLPVVNLAAQPGSAQGQLTVTLTVVSSVGIVLDENGQPRLIVANAADPADNVSGFTRVSQENTQHFTKKQKKKKIDY